MKYTIEIDTKELELLSKALQLYTKVGLLEFDKLLLCESLKKLLNKEKRKDFFVEKALSLKSVLGYFGYSFLRLSDRKVSNDVKIIADMSEIITYTLLSGKPYKSDICKINKVKEPQFKLLINS